MSEPRQRMIKIYGHRVPPLANNPRQSREHQWLGKCVIIPLLAARRIAVNLLDPDINIIRD